MNATTTINGSEMMIAMVFSVLNGAPENMIDSGIRVSISRAARSAEIGRSLRAERIFVGQGSRFAVMAHPPGRFVTTIIAY